MTTPTERRVDVLVIGAGPAGISAAVAAREAGKTVLVVDQGARPGGQVWRHRDARALPPVARRWVRRAVELGIEFTQGARVIDALSPTALVIEGAGTTVLCRAAAVVIAAGAKERFIPFPGWTLPGVVGIGGLQALIKGGLEIAGRRVVIAGTGPLLFPVAATVARASGRLLLVAEQAPAHQVAGFGLGLLAKPTAISLAVKYRWRFRRTRLRTSHWVVAAEGADRVRHVVIRGPRGERRLECDWVATSAGLVPNTELAQLLGCAVDAGAVAVDRNQATSVIGVWAAGECTGVKGDEAAIAEGGIAGAGAAGSGDSPALGALRRRRDAGRSFGARIAAAFAPRAELTQLADDQTILCRCENVRRGDIDARWSQRQAKLWTRIGMGECQGAVCGPACAALFGWGANAVRPPLGVPSCGSWRAALEPLTKAGAESPDAPRS